MQQRHRVSTLTLVIAATLIQTAWSDEPTDTVERQTLIVVIGAEGTPEYGQQLLRWAGRLETAARSGDADTFRIGGANATTTNVPKTDTKQTNDLETLLQILSEQGSVETAEPLWLVMIGHGSFDSRTARFNLRGLDLSADDLSEMCQNMKRPLAVICCFSCSAPFLNVLSGPKRVVVTGTKDGNQVQWSRFGDAFSNAFVSTDSDIDRDGQTSLLEAWLYASRRTADFYSEKGRLATEHSILDDNGDARGTRAELYDGFRPADTVKDPSTLDGRLAAKWHLIRSDEERMLTAEQRTQRDELETKLEQLKTQKGAMAEPEYLTAIELILLDLGKIYEAAAAGALDSDQP
jgi:hypothetical protein